MPHPVWFRVVEDADPYIRVVEDADPYLRED